MNTLALVVALACLAIMTALLTGCTVSYSPDGTISNTLDAKAAYVLGGRLYSDYRKALPIHNDK